MSIDEGSSNKSSYNQKKSFYGGMLTIYGRNPVKEALLHPDTQAHRLHLAKNNKTTAIIGEILELARKQKAEICYHTREALARISKNGSQDQGVAVDLICKGFNDYSTFESPGKNFELIAVDKITNASNLGMIIRSVCASPLQGLVLPRKGCAKLDAMVVKASAGNIFKCRILVCDELEQCLNHFKETLNCQVIGLSSRADLSIADIVSAEEGSKIFVLGNESEGISDPIADICDRFVRIPMGNQVESLNVAVAAGLIAFRSVLNKHD